MATVTVVCKIIPDPETGTYSTVTYVHGLSEKEARLLGDLLHDPVAVAIKQALGDRVTSDTYSWTSRGKTQ